MFASNNLSRLLLEKQDTEDSQVFSRCFGFYLFRLLFKRGMRFGFMGLIFGSAVSWSF